MSARDSRAIESDLLGLEDEATPIAPRRELRDAVLRSLTRAGALESLATRIATFFDLPAQRGLELARAALQPADSPWVKVPMSGGQEMRFLHFAGGPRVAKSHCGLVHLAPGARFPLHVHEGDEWCFVLAGTAEEDGTGVVWRAGDVAHRPSGSAHAFRVTGSEPYVFAVILDGTVRPIGEGA